jgi:PAT family beta-lactamase induction signal transducer AmpG
MVHSAQTDFTQPSIFSRRMLVILMHGLAAGLPLGMTGVLLQAWMTKVGVDLTTIGIFSLVGLPYTWKFVWAPLMDRYTPRILGRRRSWILIAQLALVPAILGLGLTNPLESPWTTAMFALLVAFFSATQDIAIDAYRTEALHPRELGLGASLYVTGYRIGVPILSVSLGLLLVDQFGMSWSAVYAVMASVMGLGVLATLLGPEPETQPQAPKTLADAAYKPFVEFFSRKGAFEILAFVVLFRLTDTIGTALFSSRAILGCRRSLAESRVVSSCFESVFIDPSGFSGFSRQFRISCTWHSPHAGRMSRCCMLR